MHPSPHAATESAWQPLVNPVELYVQLLPSSVSHSDLAALSASEALVAVPLTRISHQGVE